MADARELPGTLAATPASPGLRCVLGGVSVAYTLATLAVLPYAPLPGPVVPALTTTFGAVVFLADLCTSVLLLLQCRVAPSWALLLLAAAYGYSGAMAFLHVLTFPGAWIPEAVVVGTPQSVGWLFIAWIVGYPLLVLAALGAEACRRYRPLAAARVTVASATVFGLVLAVVVGLTLVATTVPRWLPPELHGHGFAAWAITAQWTAVGLTLAAVVALVGVTRGRSVLHGWLGLALIAFMAFNALAVAGGGRYTMGWVLSRLSGGVSASVLLVFFVGQFARLHRAVVQGLQQVHDANAQLEQRVAVRTAALTQANRTLQHEVVARQQAEAVQARLAALVASSDDAIFGKTLDGIITDWNQGAEQLYGYTPDEMVGQSLARLMPPDLPDELPALLARLRRGDGIAHYETQRVAKDGTRRDVALTISPIRDAAGQLIGASTIARDITVRKQAEAELERRRQETALLAEVAQRLSASLDLETVLQHVVMGAQALCESERAFLSLRDPGTDALVGRYESGAPRTGYVGLRLAPGQGLGAHVLRTGQPWRTADYITDPRFSKVSVAGVRAGGHLAMLAVPIQLGGQVAGVLYVSNPTTQPFTDRDEAILVRLAAHAALAMQNAQLYQQAQAELTERQQAEAALAQAAAALEQRVAERTAQLEAANRELEAFSYSVSHDLRAPLRAVNGFARILLDEYAQHLPEAAQHYLRLVVDSAQHMGQLIDDLLAFARLSRQPLTRQAVAPADLVRQVLEDLRPVPAARRLDVRIGALPPCQADPALLKQVWVNLLANALKFTSRRDVAVIEVGGHEEAGVSVYWVRDNGVGFDMAYADKLFGVFQRLHRADEYDGTGVGLALVQRIIQRHGGRIWAEAAVDQGATFFFTIGGASAPP